MDSVIAVALCTIALVFRCKGIITSEETDQNFKSQIMYISYMLSVLASWRISKQVYHFEPEMEKLLCVGSKN